MKLRFSLRAILVLTTLVGVACWWRTRPGRVADQFVAAINSGDFARADKLFANPKDAFIAEFMTHYRNNAQALTVGQSFSQWLAGECEIRVDLVDHRGLGARLQFVIPVSGRGLHKPRYSIEDAGYVGFFDPQINMER